MCVNSLKFTKSKSECYVEQAHKIGVVLHKSDNILCLDPDPANAYARAELCQMTSPSIWAVFAGQDLNFFHYLDMREKSKTTFS